MEPPQIMSLHHRRPITGYSVPVVALTAILAGCSMNPFADDEPAPPQDVIAFAASLMGVEPPPEIPYEEAEMTPMARSFYADSRHVSNAKLRAGGYNLRFPDYRRALQAMWEDGTWDGNH